MTNLQIAGLFGIGIAGVAWGYNQYQKRQKEQEHFRNEITRLERRLWYVEQMLAESTSRLHDKNEQNRVLLGEIMQLREERHQLREKLEAYRVAEFWHASA